MSKVVLVAFDDVPMFDLSTATAVFGADSTVPEPLFDFRIVSATGRPVRVREGATVTPDHPLSVAEDADTIIIPAFSSEGSRVGLDEVAACVQRAHARGTRLAAFASGVAVLAEAGLLQGRTVTTHWFASPTHAAEYPEVLFDDDSVFIDDGDIVTAGGAMAGLDCCLAIVEKDLGSAVAQAIARRMNAPMMRESDNSPYVDHPTPGSGSRDSIEPVLDWARRHLSEVEGTETLVARADMSRRHFDRRFRAVTGTTPKQWLLSIRLLEARLLLETTSMSIEETARNVGFQDALTMRPHFRKRFLVSPRDYRRIFNEDGRGPAPDGA